MNAFKCSSKWVGIQLLTLLCVSLFSVNSFAHKLAPSLLQIDELDSNSYSVIWRTPIDAAVSPRPVLPENCRDAEARIVQVSTAIERRWTTRCEGGLSGKTLRIELLAASRTVAMLLYQPLNGKLQRDILTANNSDFVVPDKFTGASVLTQYIRLGIGHILIGADHLFFVTALLLLAGSWRSLLKTVTAFTLGHSVTLALVSLELVPHWPALVEFSIAVTILILAVELSRTDVEQRKHYIRQHQWLVASVFGLVHGLGFAGVLQEIGLPSGDVVGALFAFNIGIELGQIVFVAIVAGLLYLLQRSSIPIYQHVKSAIILVMGGISVYWCLDRGAEMLGQIM